MFLLLLFLGTAGVKAQVRIGGNTAPSAAAVLDLNAGNDNVANTGTGGLVLPRVDLKNNTMQLTPGVVNQTGTMVYNVTTTLGKIGVYYWNGNSWVLASLPSTSPSDSGSILISSNGTWSPIKLLGSTLDTIPATSTSPTTITWTRAWNGTITVPFPFKQFSHVMVTIPGLSPTSYCTTTGSYYGMNFYAFVGGFIMQNLLYNYTTPVSLNISCYSQSM